MNFELSEEQVLLKDSIERYLNDHYDFEHSRSVAASDSGRSDTDWQQFAALGWLSIPFSEEAGGYGGGAVDTMVIMEQLGRGLVLEPYVESVLLAGGVLERCDQPAAFASLVAQLIAGEITAALAFHEPASRFDLANVCSTAELNDGCWILNGEKAVVFHGAGAEKIVVSARVSGINPGSNGIALFLVDAAAKGLVNTAFRMMDGRMAANITLSNVAAEALLVADTRGFSVLDEVVNRATVALCAEAVGIMDRLQEETLEYLKSREQFGVSIGSFQALQHRMVDMFAHCEQSRSILYRAVCALDEGAADAQGAIHALKVMIGRAGKSVGAEAIQLHGGMGMTDELCVGHYVKRLMMINTSFGDADYHLQQFVAHNYSDRANVAA